MKRPGLRAVIMDRDGTIFKETHYLSHPDQIEIYRGVFSALRALRRAGWKLIIGTNQSGIGRGYFTLERLSQIHAKFLRMCRREGVKIDEIFFCPHHPDADCACRKPRTGMLKKAAKKFNLDLGRSYVIGDKTADILWGRRAGARTILVLSGYGREHRRKLGKPPDHVTQTLATAAKWILKHGT